jgi:hypothetical protein
MARRNHTQRKVTGKLRTAIGAMVCEGSSRPPLLLRKASRVVPPQRELGKTQKTKELEANKSRVEGPTRYIYDKKRPIDYISHSCYRIRILAH